VAEQLRLLPSYLSAHIQLVVFAMLVGSGLSIPLGIVLSRRARLARPVLLLANTIQTVPALALLALMVPILAALRLPSIGYLPAFIALVLYGILPILRNTVSGLTSLNPAVLDAARAVGMTSKEQLFRVELPLAAPVIIAGIRTAMAWTIGMATLSTPVGGVSLGNYIFSGLQTRNYIAVLVGCIAAALLAVVLDATLGLLARGLAQRRRSMLVTGGVCLLLICAYGAASVAVTFLADSRRSIVIGAKSFTEQYVLSQVLAQRIQSASGHVVTVRPSLGSTVAFDALKNGQIDAYIEYSGTLWTTILKRNAIPQDRRALAAEVRRVLERDYQIRVVATLGFENAYALAMRGEQARRLGVSRISELSQFASRLSIGADYEFLQRPEWKAIVQTYHLRFATERAMDPTLMYQAVQQRGVDVISAFTTDPRILEFDLVLLVDDNHAIPPYDAMILVGERFWRDEPKGVRALAALEGRITDEMMRQMNLDVDQRHQSPARVAQEFLRRGAVR
jgi:osmoprotectant transport system permease protein